MRRHVTCFVEKAGFKPRTLGTKAERCDHCATRPVVCRAYIHYVCRAYNILIYQGRPRHLACQGWPQGRPRATPTSTYQVYTDLNCIYHLYAWYLPTIVFSYSWYITMYVPCIYYVCMAYNFLIYWLYFLYILVILCVYSTYTGYMFFMCQVYIHMLN